MEEMRPVSTKTSRLMQWCGGFYVDPQSAFNMWWLTIVALAIVYNAWTVILRVCFPASYTESDGGSVAWLLVDLLADTVYWCDIAVHLRTVRY